MAFFSFMREAGMTTPLLNRIPDTYEVRSFHEVRAEAEIGSFTGHASAFWYADSHGTAFAPKAFKRTLSLKEGRIPVLYFHEPKEVVGPAKMLREDKTGLYHESKAVEDGRTGSYVLAHLRGGTPMGMSFGFRTLKDRSADEADPIDLTTGPEGLKHNDIRVITEVELYEISVLPWTFASQPKADIASVRSVAEAATLSSLIEHIQRGSLTDEMRALVAELVDAFRAAPDPDPDPTVGTTPLGDDTTARRRNLDLNAQAALAHARYMGWVIQE